MKRLIPLGLALAGVELVASVLFAASTELKAQPVSQQQSSPQMSSTNYALDWSAVGEISGGAGASASYQMNATIGQMAANTSSTSTSTSYGLCTGFECAAQLLAAYLPLIRR